MSEREDREHKYEEGQVTQPPTKPFKGPITEAFEHQVSEHREHGGRLEGKPEHVLRPRPQPRGPADDTKSHALAAQRGELYAAAHRARVSRALVLTHGAAGALDRARDAANEGVRDVVAHLSAAGIDEQTPDGLVNAFADAYANCTGLIEAIEEVFEDGSMNAVASRCRDRFASLARPKHWQPPPTRYRRDAVSRAQAKSESDSLHLVISARLNQARTVLDGAVNGYLHKLTSLEPDTSGIDADRAKGEVYFSPAAEAVEIIIHEVGAASTRMHHAVRGHEPHVRDAATRLRESAQRFVHWALAGEQPLVAEANRVNNVYEPLIGAYGIRPLDMRTTNLKGDSKKAHDDFEERFEKAWQDIFTSQAGALNELATDPAPTATPRWDERLFAIITNAALSFLIGGPAGAAGSVAQDLVNGGKGGLAGALGNGVESIVTSVLTDVIATRAAENNPHHVRKRFYEQQAHAVRDAHTRLGSALQTVVIHNLRRAPNGTEVLKQMIDSLQIKSSLIAERQKTRAVQDWAVYQAQATHQKDEASGGVNMTGVGRQAPEHVFSHEPPTGVLEVTLRVEGKSIQVDRAVAGGLRSDEVAYLRGVRLRDLTMPVRFVITEHLDAYATSELARSASIVVNRNEKGVYWLRSVGDGGRQMLGRFHDHHPAPADTEVLRAAVSIIQALESTPLREVQS